jgi:hypothetical protein
LRCGLRDERQGVGDVPGDTAAGAHLDKCGPKCRFRRG